MYKNAALLTAVSVLAVGSADARLVAYFPVESTDTNDVLNDVIDDAGHGITDGNGEGGQQGAASIIYDATRDGQVVSTVNGHRYRAGVQDISLSEGFTWSLWVKSDSVANTSVNDGGTDPNGADVIIGSRNGLWNKVQPVGNNATARFFDHTYDISDDTWYHIVYTGVSTGLNTEISEFWIDGVKVSTDTSSFNNIQETNNNDRFEIGGSSRFTEDWAGLMDDIAVWNNVITDDQIARLFRGTSPQAIPEPASAAMGLVALGALAARRRRRG